jgi:hypothetical protein
MNKFIILALLLTGINSHARSLVGESIISEATFSNPNPVSMKLPDRCYCDVKDAANNGCSSAHDKNSCIRNSSGTSTGCKWVCVKSNVKNVSSH